METPPPRRASRVRLYLPFALLALVAAGWSAAWFVVRGRVVDGLDTWLAAEAAAGRAWTCADRQVAGFPFRIELGCGSIAVARPDLTATAGRLGVVAQVYRPTHVVAELAGPLAVTSGTTTATATWTILRASVVASRDAIERVAVVTDAPVVAIRSAESGDVRLAARAAEVHLRTNPADPGAADWALSATAALVPGLDWLVGGTEPADIAAEVTATRARDLPARPIAAELDRWRQAGGRLDVTRILVAKGDKRLRMGGSLQIDDAHRPAGTADLASANLEGVLGGLVGGRAGLAAGFLGALIGSRPGVAQAEPAPAPGEPALKPLPRLRLEDGRVLLGPLAIPGVRLPALY